MAKRTNSTSNGKWRLLVALVAAISQIALTCYLSLALYNSAPYASEILTLLTILIVVAICDRALNNSFKIIWIILILGFPVMGIPLYLLYGRTDALSGVKRRFQDIVDVLYRFPSDDSETIAKLDLVDRDYGNQARYLSKWALAPLYDDTDVRYYNDAYQGYLAQVEDVKKAERFIYMEYHAIEDGAFFAEMKETLKERARAGVDVRIIFDDIGSIGFIGRSFVEELMQAGIQIRSFNPTHLILSIYMNNRDHRKITVVDGRVAFTGGYNLADEYFGILKPYGHWKDCCVRLEGSAAASMSGAFLTMWTTLKGKKFDDAEFQRDQLLFRELSESAPQVSGADQARALNQAAQLEEPAQPEDSLVQSAYKGFVQPYFDNPLTGERVGESVYLNVIKSAKDYLYFSSPYLIPSDEMMRELELAAKRGVDVRIVCPGIPDKQMVFRVTRSSYNRLVRAGVRIYEYTPGFCHEKQCLCDGKVGTVGSVNLDYRSLYLHFENGVVLYDVAALDDIAVDFEWLFQISEEVTEKHQEQVNWLLRFGECILRILAPLL